MSLIRILNNPATDKTRAIRNATVFFGDSLGGAFVKEKEYAKLNNTAMMKHSVMKRVLLVINVRSREWEFKMTIVANVSIRKRRTT